MPPKFKVKGKQIDTTNINEIANIIYPVNSIYISVSSVNPTTLFGGTWAAFGTGRTLVGISGGEAEFNTIEKLGGAKTHTLSVGEQANMNVDTVSNILHSDGGNSNC